MDKIVDLLDILARRSASPKSSSMRTDRDPRPVRRRAPFGNRAAHAGTGHRRFHHADGHGGHPVARRLRQGQPLADYRAQRAAGVASRRRRSRTRISSITCSSPIRTTTSCASRTGAAATGSRFMKRRRAAATAGANRSSISSRWKRASASTPCCRSRNSPTTSSFHGHPCRARSRRRRCPILQPAQGRHHRRRPAG